MELDPEARDILLLARQARSPSAEDKARIERRLALALGAGAAAAISTSAAPAAAGTSIVAKAAGSAALLKWTLISCALIAASGAGYALLKSGPAAQHAVEAHVNRQPAVPAGTSKTETVAQTVAKTETETETETVAETETETETETVAATGRARAVHRGPARSRAADPLRDELELLHAAQAAWRAGDAKQALALTADHERRHPHSALALERDALRVLALCDAGKPQEAKRLARSWLTRAPNSPLRASIEASCAGK